MSCFYLLHDNLIPKFNNVGNISSIEFSSNQLPQGIGIYYSTLRGRSWRTAGYFKVETGSNQIIFRESTGVDLVASVAVAEYTDRDSYLAAVKAALDAAGASTYTITITTAKKTYISSDGAGGTGIFQIMSTDLLSATQASFLGYDTSADLTGSLAYSADFVSIHQHEFIEIDLGLAQNPKAFIMVGPSQGQIQLSDTCTVKLQGNHTTNWTSPSYNVTIPYHPDAMIAFNALGLGSDEYRYWRLLIEDKTNAAGYLDIFPVYLGDAYAPSRGAVQFPLSSEVLNFTDEITLNNGSLFGSKANIGRSFNIDYSALKKDEVEYINEIFRSHGRTLPLFIMGDVSAVYSTEAEYMCRMVKFSSNPTYRLESPDFFSLSMTLYEEM